MVDQITYRGTDATRWGGGLGADLSANQIDINFWVLASQLAALQDHAGQNADIDYFVVNGNQMFVHLTNHAVLGPYILPTAQWNFRGPWAPVTVYAPYDIVTDANATYMILFPHTSAATFSASANDGLGHNYYGLLIAAATNALTPGGTIAQRLTKNSGTDFDASWVNDYRNMALFISGQPNAGELVLRYVSPDTITLPIGLAGSQAGYVTAATASAVFPLAKNGAAIGSVIFPTSGAVSFAFTGAVTFAPGDILTINAPAVQDTTLADISITLRAAITG